MKNRGFAYSTSVLCIIIIIIIVYGAHITTANARASDMGTINSSDRIVAKLYSLGKWFVSGIYV
jgi:hypothetical protein